MPKKVTYYYTFKVSELKEDGGLKTVECTKWEELGEPVGVYKVKPGHYFQGCDCPAYRQCKHQKCVDEAIETGKIEALWEWRWDEVNGWTRLNDINTVEELEDGS